MLIIQKFEDNAINRCNEIFIQTINSGITYSNAKTLIEEYRYLIKNCNYKIIGVEIKRSIELVCFLLACLYEKKLFFIFEKDMPQKKREYIIETAYIDSIVTLENNNIKITSTKVYNNLEYLDNVAQILFTSGSTSMPKGVMITYDNYDNFFNDVINYFNFNRSSNFISIASVNFDMFMSELITSIAFGLEFILANEEEINDPIKMIELINSFKVENILTTPSKLKILLMSDELDAKNLKNILLGGEAIDNGLFETIKKNSEARVFNLYGPTEATCHCMRYEVIDNKNMLLGVPVNNCSIKILGEDGKEIVRGKGRLLISGACVTKGYIGFDDESFINYDGKHSFLTSDIVEIKDDGSIIYLGRNEEIIKINGQRISLFEIEQRILDFDKIFFAKTIFYQNKIIAFWNSNFNIDPNEIRKYLRTYLYDYSIPNEFYKIDKIQLNQNGKLDNNYFHEFMDKQNSIQSANKLSESVLIEVIEQILKKSINKKVSFYENGGDSLSAMRIIVILKQRGVNLSIKNLLKAENILTLENSLLNSELCTTEDIEKRTQSINLTPMQKYMLSSNEDIDRFVTHTFLDITDGLDNSSIELIFKNIILKYDGLTLYLNKTEKKLNRSDDYSVEISDYEINDLSIDNVMDVYRKESTKCSTKKSSSLKLARIRTHNKELLLILVHHFFIDALSWNILLQEVDSAFNNINNNLLNISSDSYIQYLTSINKYLDAEYSKNIDFLLEELYSPYLKKLEYSENIAKTEDFYQLYLTIPENNNNNKINQYEFYTGIANALHNVFNTETNLVELETNGRQFQNNYYFNSIGWFTTPFNFPLRYDNTVSFKKNTEAYMELYKKYKEFAFELSNLKSDFNSTSILSKSPKFVINFLGEINPIGLDIKRMYLLDSESTMEEKINVFFEIYFVGYFKENEFIINIKYNKYLYDYSTIQLLGGKICESLQEVSC